MADGSGERRSRESNDGSGSPPPARRRRRSALAWGAVAALSFLVLHQAYLLSGGRFVGVVPVAAVALAVGTAGAALSFLLERRLAVRRR